MNAFSLRSIACVLGTALLCASSGAAQGGESYVGRPVYSEPGSGLQLPPSCHMEPTWRARIGTSDLEVWVIECGGIARSWFLRRSLIEMVAGNQARLRFQVLDERQWPGETAGDTLSVQCIGKNGPEAGYVVLGAKWRAVGNELRLTGAQSVIRADPNSQKFVAASLAQVECTRHPEREAMLRRLQQAPR
jgi:hypothetical protein